MVCLPVNVKDKLKLLVWVICDQESTDLCKTYLLQQSIADQLKLIFRYL